MIGLSYYGTIGFCGGYHDGFGGLLFVVWGSSLHLQSNVKTTISLSNYERNYSNLLKLILPLHTGRQWLATLYTYGTLGVNVLV